MSNPLRMAARLVEVFFGRLEEITNYNPTRQYIDITWKGHDLRIFHSEGIEDYPERFFVEERIEGGTLQSGGEIAVELANLLNTK